MGLPLRFTLNGEDEAKAANYPDIRFFTVAGHPAYRHTDLVQGKWSEVTPQTADWVSAVAYYFARRVQQDIHVPIGLVLDDVGGTPAEAWTSAEALASDEGLRYSPCRGGTVDGDRRARIWQLRAALVR